MNERTIHLTGVVLDRKATAIRAVRDGFVAAGLNREAALVAADEAVHQFLNTQRPVGLVAKEAPVVEAFLEAYNAVVDGSAQIALDQPQEALNDPQTTAEQTDGIARRAIAEKFMRPPPLDWEPSREGARTALVMLAMHNGSAQAAWIWLQKLAFATGDLDTMLDAGRLLEDTFGRGDA